MRRFVNPVLVLLALLLALSGCASREKIQTEGEASILFKPGAKRTEQTVGLGNRITLTLPPTEPDQIWQIAFHDARFLVQLTGYTAPAETGGGASIAFAATRPGTTRLRFVLLPKNAGREAIPSDAHDVVITVR